jgi:hypothetical protein
MIPSPHPVQLYFTPKLGRANCGPIDANHEFKVLRSICQGLVMARKDGSLFRSPASITTETASDLEPSPSTLVGEALGSHFPPSSEAYSPTLARDYLPSFLQGLILPKSVFFERGSILDCAKSFSEGVLKLYHSDQ